MAGFADPPTLPPAPSRRPLPNGPCNYRDASLGPCGCDQFWDKLSADLHDESTEHRPGSERSTWCVCGHHACFHLKASRAPERRAPSISVPLPSPHALCEGQCQTLPTAPCDAHAGLRLAAPGGPQSMRLERFNSQFTHSQRHLLHTSRVHESGRIAQSQDTPSQASTSGLPGIPSVCLLSHEQRPVANNEIRHGVSQSHHSVTGLGLSTMRLESMCQVNRQQSPTPTIPDDINIAGTLQTNRNERDHSLTRANTNSPSRAILEHVLPFNRNIQLDIPGDTIPNTYNPEEYVQSTTEVATPSAGATPDLSAADRAVQEGKNLIDTLARMTSDMQPQAASSPERPTNATMPTQLLLENSPSVPQEQLQNLLQTASPQGLQKLVSYLAPLHNLLNSIPNVANTMRDLGSRLDMLENGSFNYVQPEDLNQTLEMYEGRLIEVEHRVDEHEKMHQALDDHGSISSFSRRHIKDVNTSFGSNHSADSTTSSALILAAMDRKDTEMELDYIKQRLDVLEAAAPPTSLASWEIEVVLLPWGPDLRGIWFSQDDPMHDVDRTTTQSSEEWTQARSSRTSMSTPMLETRRRDTDSSPYPGAPMLGSNSVLNQHESGWSSQDITNWASGSTDDWLFPKACGSNNLVYKRLQSRGFVRDITLRGASAKDVQETLSNAFSDVFDHLQYDDSDENPMIAAYPGLRASYIPLRKVLRESRLRFLTPAEMSSSAFWTAQFLASGVMMRVSGGKKRLYVTHREAYTQQVDRNEFVVMEQSWPELRQLPRYQPEKNSQTDGNDEDCQPHVPEADAKEACWQFVEAYDAPPASMHSSFGSNQSVQLSMRPAGRQWRRSITPSSILKKHTHPISPLSENHPRRPSSHRNRTVSASAMDTFPPSSAKRRYNGSPIKQSSAPQTVSRTPSLMPRLKRRRVTESASPRPQEDAREEPQVPIWTATPRRSREPPSPFYSSQHPLPRSYSDITSRPSQRSVTVTGKSTPFAYATPHSGPFTGGPGYSAYNNGGDTEPDDDDNAYNDDDGEQSWHGVTDGESVSSSVAGAAIGAQEGASFSGDDSGFGSDNDDDSDAQSEEDAEDHAQRQQDDGDEDEDDVFDSLLSVIED
ncbi:hypothetical protein COCCADRAFT_100245 [Bipolaris zeicola 26-R-13]|uniref:Uncharacterized protein n=1 Tax=Cochliobolus carbonum (strain 26-R-13) TaxID=930089 RepID=W6XWP1_COCC2|nr:uncharacterized protein COCCADRAFT_100245 [Bipolaris zeicola 26-R-13]EUC31857.1 hypothetical protein COCCADRAFT_100245 [Bipolaris zeicola 26-R-13]